MAELVPAILGQDFRAIEHQLELLDGRVNWAQLDVADGHFAPTVTWSEPAVLSELTGRIKLEIHLMVQRPEQEVVDWLAVADRIIFHPEATTDPALVFQAWGQSPVRKGLALLLTTPLEMIDRYLEQIDEVQLMGIAEIGRQGLAFDQRVIRRVKILHERYPQLIIAVDGGVSLTNAPDLLAAGARRLVVGSALWRAPDLTTELTHWQELLAGWS